MFICFLIAFSEADLAKLRQELLHQAAEVGFVLSNGALSHA